MAWSVLSTLAGQARLWCRCPPCARLADRLREADRLFLANNFYSVDFCAFTPASTLLAVDPPANDNGLGWLLGGKAKLPCARTGADRGDHV